MSSNFPLEAILTSVGKSAVNDLQSIRQAAVIATADNKDVVSDATVTGATITEATLRAPFTSNVVPSVLEEQSKQKAPFHISTNRNSFYLADIVSSNGSIIRSIYKSLKLKPLGNTSLLQPDDILLIITQKWHIDILGTGKVALKIKHVNDFCKKINEINSEGQFHILPALAIPTRLNANRLFHPQFDIDREKYTLEGRNQDAVLVDENEIIEFKKVWKGFIDKHVSYTVEEKNNYDGKVAKNANLVGKCASIHLHRRAPNSGIHLFVRNIRMITCDVKKLVNNAVSNTEIRALLEKHNLRLDEATNYFVAGTDKSGARQNPYREIENITSEISGCSLNFFNTINERFPVCCCSPACSEVSFCESQCTLGQSNYQPQPIKSMSQIRLENSNKCNVASRRQSSDNLRSDRRRNSFLSTSSKERNIQSHLDIDETTFLGNKEKHDSRCIPNSPQKETARSSKCGKNEKLSLSLRRDSDSSPRNDKHRKTCETNISDNYSPNNSDDDIILLQEYISQPQQEKVLEPVTKCRVSEPKISTTICELVEPRNTRKRQTSILEFTGGKKRDKYEKYKEGDDSSVTDFQCNRETSKKHIDEIEPVPHLSKFIVSSPKNKSSSESFSSETNLPSKRKRNQVTSDNQSQNSNRDSKRKLRRRDARRASNQNNQTKHNESRILNDFLANFDINRECFDTPTSNNLYCINNMSKNLPQREQNEKFSMFNSQLIDVIEIGETSLNKAVKAAYGRMDIFLPENVLQHLMGQNVLCMSVYEYTVPLMMEEMSKMVSRGESSSKKRRYSCEHLATTLITYCCIIWNRHPEASKFTLGKKEFCVALMHAIVNRCAIRAEADLSLLWRELKHYVHPILPIVELFVSENTPMTVEVIFALLHMSLWSTSSPSNSGIPLCSGEFIALSPLVGGIVKEYLRNRLEFFNSICPEQLDEHDESCGINRNARFIEGNSTAVTIETKKTKLAQTMQRLLKHSLESSMCEPLVAFLLALAYPYDGELAWSTNINPSWMPIREEEFKARILEPAHCEIVKLVNSCPNPQIPPKILPDGSEKPTFFKLALSCHYYLRCGIALWRILHSKMQFPTKLIMTSDNRIFSVQNCQELRNVPCLRTSQAFSCGTSSSNFRNAQKNAVKYVLAISHVASVINKLPHGCYLSYPNAQISWDDYRSNTINSNVAHASALEEIRFEQRLQDMCNAINDARPQKWHRDFFVGCLSLFELFGTSANLEKFIRFHREVKYRGRRKKVAVCFSNESNHGKSTCVKVLQGVYGESCQPLSFAAMSAESDANMTNSVVVGAAGKVIAFIDELPTGSRARCSQLSMHKIKLLTGGTTSSGYRELYSNSSSQFYNCAVITFSNCLPGLSETGDADIQRLYPIKFPRKFRILDDDAALKEKISKTYLALDAIMISLEICSNHAETNQTETDEEASALKTYLDAMQCRKFDGTPFTIEDDRKDMDPRTCVDYEECMQFYNEESRIILNFVSKRNMLFKSHDWATVKIWFEEFVQSEFLHKSSRIETMLQKVYDRYSLQRHDEVDVSV